MIRWIRRRIKSRKLESESNIVKTTSVYSSQKEFKVQVFLEVMALLRDIKSERVELKEITEVLTTKLKESGLDDSAIQKSIQSLETGNINTVIMRIHQLLSTAQRETEGQRSSSSSPIG